MTDVNQAGFGAGIETGIATRGVPADARPLHHAAGTGIAPIVPLARALEVAGHEVAVAAAASFAAAIEAAGLRAFPAGLDWSLSEPEAALPGFLDAEGPQQILTFAQLATRGMVDDLLAVGRDWQPDVIVRDATEYAGWVAAERLGIPHATYAIGLRLPGPMLRMWTGDTLAGLPKIYGLAPDPDLGRMFEYLFLNFVPESFEMPGRTSSAPSVHISRAWRASPP